MIANKLFVNTAVIKSGVASRQFKLPAHGIVSECLHNSQNENNIKHKNLHRMKSSVLSRDELYGGF